MLKHTSTTLSTGFSMTAEVLHKHLKQRHPEFISGSAVWMLLDEMLKHTTTTLSTGFSMTAEVLRKPLKQRHPEFISGSVS